MNQFTWQSLLLLILLVSDVPAMATSSDAVSDVFDSSSSHGVALVEWLRSRNGIFNEKLEIRRADPDDASSRIGIFTTQRIYMSELLIGIPTEIVVKGRIGEGALKCDTVRSLVREMRLGDHSEFAPYVRYLLAQSPGQLPSAWSEAGKEMLLKVLGVTTKGGTEMVPPLDAVGWIESEWRNDCNGSDDPFEENAAMLVVQRSWDEYMIPVYDMLSHRNGKWLNTEDNGVDNSRIDVTATRNIEEGEELNTSYNFCTDCGNRALTYGTPEILRDYGFVEAMPQRWIFSEAEADVSFELDDIDGPDTGKLQLSWLDDNYEPSDSDIEYLSEQLQRLNELAHTDYEGGNDSLPKHEWDVIWQYHQAITIAITHAITHALGEDDELNMCPAGKSTCAVSDTYVTFDYEEDDLNYNVKTCDNQEHMLFEEYKTVGEVKSAYQMLTYVERPEDGDMCFDLDDTVQICSSYRPHYHESVVHYTARYIDNVRRVVFVGGGDSMLLHEVVKYPNLELVMGLELDQKVTRNSFKHFGSQPHFDDERVEWWFGDATKSLLMLPRDYFGSFDMVLVDLSETVMSFLVTEELDVMEALALLLKPDGVFVKNELYMGKMSEMFDYAIQIYWQENPMICDQSLILGSNRVDFLHHPLTEHNIKNLWIEPLDIDDHFGLIHDYSNNNTGEQGKCEEPEKAKEEYLPQVRSAGILMIVEAEDATAPLKPLENIERTIFTALEKEGLTPLSTVSPPSSSDQRSVTVIILREGYVVARLWPEHNYCAFDIHLWGGFKKMESLRSALIASVGSSSESSSSYRIVVGGMFGSSTWRHDQENLGPLVTKTCKGEAKSVGDVPIDQAAIDIVLEESMNLLQKEEAVVAVLCGDRTQSCNSLDVLAENKNIQEVIVLWACPTIKDINEYAEDAAEHMFACKSNTLNTLRESLMQKEKLSAIIIDPSAPIAMTKIVHKILTRKKNTKELLLSNVMFMAMMLDETETWRRNFLEKIRKNIKHDPLNRAEIVFSSSDKRIEMGITSLGDPSFFIHLLEVTKSIKNRSGLDADIRKIQGGVWNFQPDYNPRIYSPEEYDQRSPQEQYDSQRPMGHQTIFQLEVEKGDKTDVTMSTLLVKDALDHTLSMMNFVVNELKVISDVGDGCVIVAGLLEGNVIVVWDGNLHVDINLFTYTENVIIATQFSKRFMAQIPKMKVSLRDEQPRGFGRVVNFIEDIYPTSS